MNSRALRILLAFPLSSAALIGTGQAQCLDWRGGLEYAPDGIPPGSLFASLVVHDDGAGPALYAGGRFSNLGGVPGTENVARWTNAGWQALGAGLPWSSAPIHVRALCSFDDGSGAALYAGGWFSLNGLPVVSSLARWNGALWEVLGTNQGRVQALTVFDDGSGPALYGAGRFFQGSAAYPAARWNGSTWVVLDGGVAFPSSEASALTVHDDGTGPALYVGAVLSSDGTIQGVGKWNGSTWLPLASGIQHTFTYRITALLSHDDGTGPALYAAGTFAVAGGGGANNIARWNGTAWSPLGAGTDGPIEALLAFDAGSGPALYATGSFAAAGNLPAQRFARWSQGNWSAPAPGLELGSSRGYAMAAFDRGSGAELYLGGVYDAVAGLAANGLARWSSAGWSALAGEGAGTSGAVRAVEVLDDGNGPALWVAGDFLAAGRNAARRVARWDGSGWDHLSNAAVLPVPVNALAAIATGSTQEIYAGGGSFAHPTLARSSGSGWLAVTQSPNNSVCALETFDDGSGTKLFVGGAFDVAGPVYLGGIGRFDGANWAPVGSGMDGAVRALTVFDEGAGPRLFAGGTFVNAGGTPASFVARWDGSSWTALGSGMDGHVLALLVHDDGSGPALYAGGAFSSAGGLPASGIARWNGVGWSALGGGVDGVVNSLTSHDDGGGSALYAGGDFATAGGLSARRIARWSGSAWSALGAGLDGSVFALGSFDDGSGGGADLFVGGNFATAGARASASLAIWEGCAPIDTFCFGDASLTACPCANFGLPGHGCRNSATVRGAELTPSGTTAPDTLLLSVGFEPATALSIFLQGDALLSSGGAFFGDGLRCVGGSLKRLYTKNASAGSVQAPGPGDPAVSVRSAALGDVIPPGATRYYQTYYRDPDASFCPAPAGSTFNVSNGARVRW